MILTTENASSPASAQGSGGNAPTLALARLTPRLRLVLAIVLIADVLDLMDSTTTNIAAPTIVREIGGGESPVKWLGASYALAIGVLLVVGGRLGDRFGKRRMFLIGIAGFGLASVFCGLSIGPTMLIAGRFVQGGFGAVLIPQGAGLLLKTFSGIAVPRRRHGVRPGSWRFGRPTPDRRWRDHQRQNRQAELAADVPHQHWAFGDRVRRRCGSARRGDGRADLRPYRRFHRRMDGCADRQHRRRGSAVWRLRRGPAHRGRSAPLCRACWATAGSPSACCSA